MKEIIVTKVGNYSTGLVSFIVIQGLTYSFYFGSNREFKCTVNDSVYLAEGLSILFFVVAMFALYAVTYLGRIEASLVPEYASIVERLTKGKQVVVLLFGLLPFVLTLFYGVFGSLSKACP